MTEEQIQQMVSDFNLALNLEDAALVCITVAAKEDNGEVIFTAFNPHFRKCRCSSCKETVELAKLQVNNTDDFGMNLSKHARKQ